MTKEKKHSKVVIPREQIYRRISGLRSVGMYYTYILSNKNNTVIYTGVTNNLERRLYEHKNKLIDGFTSKYNVNKLVYYVEAKDINEAILYEKKIKGWTREKKNQLIESVNPQWKDLSETW